MLASVCRSIESTVLAILRLTPASPPHTAYLFRRRWETRAAAALALERVGLAVAHEALAQVLFGLAQVAEGEGGGESGDCHEAQPAAHGGLLSLAGLDLGRVLRDGEPLLASTGEVSQGRAASIENTLLCAFAL